MKDYYFEGRTFVINNYLEKGTFSNFLPGLAGKKGIPLWAFYVNRGQGISGFGLADKNHPIMEFTPANKAYESVGQIGFRTFYKINGSYYEPFVLRNNNDHKMKVDREKFEIEDIEKNTNLHTKITYFGLPSENLGGLVRILEVTNNSNENLEIELLDGLSEILPAGIKNAEFKVMSNLLTSWMDVEDLDNDFAFYKLRSSTGDESEVVSMRDGNFLFGHMDGKLIRPIVDQELIFGKDSLRSEAHHFINSDLKEITNSSQVTVNKVPCGFIPVIKTLKPGETIKLNMVIGHTQSNDFLKEYIQKATKKDYIETKKEEARNIIDELLKDVETSTSHNAFNEYVKQNYLDNFLRGGYPYKIGNTIYHLYSRRHGDLERDYNFFQLAPEYYSNGGGNFRDVCQNRRMDSFIHRDVEAFNVYHFAQLMQIDGYNPLTVNGMTYHIKSDSLREELVKRHFNTGHKEINQFLNNRFTPGGLVNFVENNQFLVKSSDKEYLDDIIQSADEYIESAFGEGYWVDHFTYLIDLVDSFEAIYPDQMKELLFTYKRLKSFDSPVTVLPKDQKSVINKEGNIRQYGSLLHFDQEKIDRLGINVHGSNFVKFGDKDYETNLYTKLFTLVLNKHSLLDPEGIGIEMEANKPGWNDAMNGLPGIFGSGVGETIETLRIVDFLLAYLEGENLELPIEINQLFEELTSALTYQERVTARERYRISIRFGLNGESRLVDNKEIKQYLTVLKEKLTNTLEKLYVENDGIVPTFITYNAETFDEMKDEEGSPVIGNYNMPLVHVEKYSKRYLPKFLEAPARLLKTDFDKDKLEKMHHKIKSSGIYDDQLKMYKTSECLEEETNEIGRIRAFTKGWLERESNFLHMTYKYLLGLLKAGLYEEYYEEIKDNLVCFMDPAVYKRSTLENSSFIAPSNNPNPNIHGHGFFARLSGSTVEVMNMWSQMMTGGKPFTLLDGKAILKFEPKLHKTFFKEDKTVSFTFLKETTVTYHNEDLINTYEGGEIVKMELMNDSETIEINHDYIPNRYALQVRDGFYKKINIYIKKIGGNK
jgi:hypothetical protein